MHTRLEMAGFLCLSSSSSFEAGRSDAYALIPSMVVLPPKAPSTLQFLAATFSPTWKHQTLRYSTRAVSQAIRIHATWTNPITKLWILTVAIFLEQIAQKQISTCITRSIPSNAILAILPISNSLSNTYYHFSNELPTFHPQASIAVFTN